MIAATLQEIRWTALCPVTGHQVKSNRSASESQGSDTPEKLRVLFEIASTLSSPEHRDLRRSPRLPSDAILCIYGHAPGGEAFYTHGRAVNVSQTGALIMVANTLSCGDEILLVNQANSQEQLATVVRFAGKKDGFEQVGVAFAQTNSSFWKDKSAGSPRKSRNDEPIPDSNRSPKKKRWNRQGHR